MRPVALWRRNEEAARELARDYEVERAESARALVRRDDVDAIVITTPPGCHHDEVLLAVEAGKPVLVEKPVTGTFAQARELLAAVGTPPRVPIMVAQTLRYNQTLLQARERWNEVGDVHRIRLQQRLEPSDLAWQRDVGLAGGGSIVLTGVHLFDTMRWLVGRSPDAVQCRMFSLLGHPLENLFDACFEYEAEPLLAATEVSKFSQSRSGHLDVVGTRAQLLVDYGQGRLSRLEGSRVSEAIEPGDAPTLPPCLADFARVIRGEMESPIDARDGFETLRMAEACYRSHEEGRRVRLDEVR
jgi:predicted dehydrogenase